MLSLEEINISDLKDDFLHSGEHPFNLYPVDKNIVNYHQRRLGLNPKNVILLALIENSVIKGVLEHSKDTYDSKLLGIKAGSLKNIFIPIITSENVKDALYSQLLNHYLDYLKKENYQFIFSSVENSNSVLSLALQKQGFQYILTWGKCFQTNKTAVNIQNDYSVSIGKRKEDLSFILDMAKTYFRGGRFYLDPKIGAKKADQMYIDLINNSFEDKNYNFSVLYKSSKPIGCFIFGRSSSLFENNFLTNGLRFLVYDKNEGIKGLPEIFLRATTNFLLEQSNLVESGIEMHNLASMKVHLNAGYRFNYIFSAYHCWLS